MKKEIAEKWVKALRSGDYQQGIKRLKIENRFCCLGVLCDISKLTEWDIDQCYFDKIGILPTEVMEWAGMRDSAGIAYKTGNYNELNYDDGTIHLTNFNDKGYSFTKIADIIEQNWEIL